MKKCKHYWNYENSTPYETGKKDICLIRRWCQFCGLVQITETTGNWNNHKLGEAASYGEFPDNYPEEFKSRKDLVT